MPGIGFETIMRFRWAELKEWHKAAAGVYKTMRGID